MNDRTSSLLKLLIVSILVLTGRGIAHADHTETERIRDNSPYTPKPGEMQMGLASVVVGLGGHPLLRMMEIGTNPWLWTTNVGGVRSYNVRGKYKFYSDDILSLSVRSAVYQIGKANAQIRLVPVELYAGLRLYPNVTVGAGYKYVNLRVKGGVEITEDLTALGDVGFSTAQFLGMAEYRLSKLTAFVLRGSVHRYQRVRVEAAVTDDGDQGGVFVDKNLLGKQTAFNVTLVTAWSWNRLNIELGLGYGNLEVPGISAVVPVRSILPAADLYWRF